MGTKPPAASAARRGPGTSTRKRFALAGRSIAFDPRTSAIRNDLSDIALAGRRIAAHYARAVPMSCASASFMHERPASASIAVSQILRGETFQLLDVTGGWAWGYSAHDNYVGYVPRAALSATIEPTHIVTALDALIFADADIKAPVVGHLSAGSRIQGSPAGDFLALDDGYVHGRQVAPAGTIGDDWTEIASIYLGQPYLWSGRGAGGIDCSGLVQMALGACGIAAPRDTDLQREALGEPLPEDAPLRRGDLVFFPGHVGIMADEANLLHANAEWMATVIEPLADVVARLSNDHAQPVLARRRIKK